MISALKVCTFEKIRNKCLFLISYNFKQLATQESFNRDEILSLISKQSRNIFARDQFRQRLLFSFELVTGSFNYNELVEKNHFYFTHFQNLICHFFKDNFALDYFAIIGDGNCFFRALSLLFYGKQDFHPVLRKSIRKIDFDLKEHLTNHLKYTSGEIEYNLKRKWGSDIDINIVCYRLKCNIAVYNYNLNTWFIMTGFRTGEKYHEESIFLSHTGGNHYDLLLPGN
jgi:hypothetical protein